MKTAYKVREDRQRRYQDIRGHARRGMGVLKKTGVKKIDLMPTHATLGMSGRGSPTAGLVMLIRAYGGCLGTKSR